jgi:hypothetical protein
MHFISNGNELKTKYQNKEQKNDITTKTTYQIGLNIFQESVLLIISQKLLVLLHFHLVELFCLQALV